MNKTSIRIIQQVMKGNNTKKTLKSVLAIKDWQLNETLKKLHRDGYLVLNGRNVSLPETAKGILLRSVSENFDIAKILRGANETIFPHLTIPQTVLSLERHTGLSRPTIYSAISDLGSIGAIKKDGRKIQINELHEKLCLFARILRTEIEHAGDPDGHTLFKDEFRTLKKVPMGSDADGELTGFSLYPDYGVEYHATYNYYIRQDKNLRLEDVLIHSVYSAYREENKAQMIMCIIFYLKNRNRLDVLELRRTASEFKIADVWVDIEGYIQDNRPKNGHLFLPKKEFVEKADLYDIPPNAYDLPEGFPELFEEVGRELPQKITAYLLGGENMRIKGLKPRTKDCDLLVQDRADHDTLVKTLAGMGYEMLNRTEFSKEDARMHPSTLLVHFGKSRIDLYTKKILRTLSLSEGMIARAYYENFQNLNLGILRNEDVFLLKSVTCRVGDIQDMAALAQKAHGSARYGQDTFDWGVLWDEIVWQEREDVLQNFTPTIMDSLELLAERTGTTFPFRNRLHRHVTDQNLTRLLRAGPLPLRSIADYLSGDKTSGQFIRNRVDFLARSGMLKKEKSGKNIMIRLTAEISFPKHGLKLNAENIETYLRWRFPMMDGATPRAYEKLAGDLARMGMRGIDQLDGIIIPALDNFVYEKRHNMDDTLLDVDALRICMRQYDK